MAARRGKNLKAYGRYGSVGIELVLSFLIGLYLGKKGDDRFGTTPWLMMLGMAVGAYAGFRVVFKAAAQMQAEAEREEARDRQDRSDALAGRTRAHDEDDA